MNKFHSTIYSGIVNVGKKVTKYADGKNYTTYFLVINGECSGLSPSENVGYTHPEKAKIKIPISREEYDRFRTLKKSSKRACPIRINGTLEIIVDTD